MATTKAAVQTADRRIEIREFEIPDRINDDQALLRVEASGMCGSDWEQYQGDLADSGIVEYPCIPGHEPIGVIEQLGDDVVDRWDADEGDRVALEPILSCGVCGLCVQGKEQMCKNREIYGYIPTTEDPSLWGGYAGYMVLKPNTVMHRLPEHLSTEDAVLFNPLGAGFDWALRAAGTRPGDTVLIMGPGQRGLASVIACNEGGAEEIIVTGLDRDRNKLELAREYGATHTINVDREDTVERVNELVGERAVDRVVDVTPHATEPIVHAMQVVAPGGTIVAAGSKE